MSYQRDTGMKRISTELPKTNNVGLDDFLRPSANREVLFVSYFRLLKEELRLKICRLVVILHDCMITIALNHVNTFGPVSFCDQIMSVISININVLMQCNALKIETSACKQNCK
jgi:hypothetical protein